MVDDTELGGVALGLESSEEGLLGTENLDSRGGVLCEVGQGTSLGDKTSTDSLANESSQVGSDNAHLGDEVVANRLAVLVERNDALGESHNVLHVSVRDVLTHGDLCGVDDAAGNSLVIVDNGGNVVDVVLGESLLVLDQKSELGVFCVVGDNLDQLGEVPAVPFTDTHREEVDGLVEVVDGSNSLDNVVVVLLDAELDLGTRVGVTKTKLGTVDIAGLELLEELLGVKSQTTEEVGADFGSLRGLALERGESSLDASSKTSVGNTEDGLVLLAGLGHVGLEDGLQVVGHDALGDEVSVLESLGGALERSEGDELDHLAWEVLGGLRKHIYDIQNAIPNLARSCDCSWTSLRR